MGRLPSALLLLSLAALLTALLPAQARTADVHQFYLADDDDSPKLRLYLPPGIDTLRGILVDLGDAHTADRHDLQAFVRTQRFALVGLSRSRQSGAVLEDLRAHLESIGRQTGHPELPGLPLVLLAWGKAGKQALACVAEEPNRIIAVVGGGVPIAAADLDDDARLKALRTVPVLTINGADDPFVGGMEWARQTYPLIRKLDLPWTLAVQHGHGRTEGNGMALVFPWLDDVIAHWSSTDSEPATERPPQPFTVGQGFLAPVDGWTGTAGAARPHAEYDGDPTQAVWLPSRRAWTVWRSFVTKEPAMELAISSQDNGALLLNARFEGDSNGDTRVRFYAGETLLGEDAEAPFMLQTDGLDAGIHAVHAELLRDDEVAGRSRPIVVVDGTPLGPDDGRASTWTSRQPENLLALQPAQRETLHALQAARDLPGEAEWAQVFADDFAGRAVGEAWNGGSGDSTLSLVDGALQIDGQKQAMALLFYYWPQDIAVEYRARAVGPPSDLSVMLESAGDEKYPWWHGWMFLFGTHENKHSHFRIAQEPGKYVPQTIQPDTWHRIRVQRLGDTLTAWVDGEQIITHQLTPDQIRKLHGRQFGFYTSSAPALFDDLKIHVRRAVEPSPAGVPDADERRALAAALLRLLSAPDQHREQRDLAWQVLEDYLLDLAPALQSMADTVDDPNLRRRVEELLARVPPAL